MIPGGDCRYTVLRGLKPSQQLGEVGEAKGLMASFTGQEKTYPAKQSHAKEGQRASEGEKGMFLSRIN